MPALVNYGGDMYSNFMDSSLILSVSPHVEMYCPPRKRARISAPLLLNEEAESGGQTSIDVLPDECLYEIFRRMSSGKEKSSCASVSKRWLWLLGSISRSECVDKPALNCAPDQSVGSAEESGDFECDGLLSRCLEGKKATDVRLAAIAVGTSSHGGLGKLMIRGTRRVSNLGLAAIARGCPSLKILSLWDASSVGDEGVAAIGNGCHMLEKLDICHCPLISDKGLVAVAQNCPNLTSITIESCSNIGNIGLKEIARSCPNLRFVEIKDCPLVGDQGVAGLVTSDTSSALTKIKLQSVNITDASLAVIGFYGKSVTDLSLTSLHKVSERGFWLLGTADGLQMLKSLAITACPGVTDLALEAIGKCCTSLKQFHLFKCPMISDVGLKAFARSAVSLESLHLEECNRITRTGVLVALNKCGAKLKSLALVKCKGIRENLSDLTDLSEIDPCKSLRSLMVRYCPGFGSAGLALVGRLCPRIKNLDLEGTYGATDAGILMLLESCEPGFVKVNLKGCINLSDSVISALCRLHGITLEYLNLDGCRKITDQSLVAVAETCILLTELDMSNSGVTDMGLAVLARQKWLELQIFSLSCCSNVTDKCIPFLCDLGRSLVGLNLQQCQFISSRSVELLGQQLWKCDILF